LYLHANERQYSPASPSTIVQSEQDGSKGKIANALVQLEVDLLRDLRERVLRVLGPEEVLGVEVVSLLAELAGIGRL
jgi:hypothetical protein